MAKEKTAVQLLLEEQEKRWAPKRSTMQKALDSFQTLLPDDDRWTHKSAVTCGNAYVFVETEAFRIYPFSQKLQATVPINVEWWLVHVMDSTKLKPTSFKAYLHHGIWRFAASAWVLQRARGTKFDFGPPPVRPPYVKGVPRPNPPFEAQRQEMVKYLAGSLGVKADEAARLFWQWTGH